VEKKMPNSKYQKLFEPAKIGKVQLKKPLCQNRRADLFVLIPENIE